MRTQYPTSPTTQVRASVVVASDVLVFAGSAYKVRSAVTRDDRVELVFWGTNDHQPYAYEATETMQRVL